MLKDDATLSWRAWLNRSCLAGTVVGWLVPIVRYWVQARVRADWRYRQLSCPESAAAVAGAVEQLGAAHAAEQLGQPAAEGAARQPTAAATAASDSNCSSSNSSCKKQRSSYKGGSLQQQTNGLILYIVNKLNSCPIKEQRPKKYFKN